ncbi:hypothetical protein EDC01DRAFT_665861 [Geopyxis carbonaria]|nr:hypothetical protein EDC01DRAFT_665861 [Geopyxis carbonaria]
MANNGYDVVVDVDDEGDLGHTDLADLEFHQSNYNQDQTSGKIPQSASRGGFFSGSGSGTRSGGDGSTGGGKRFLWSLDFYAQFFDVDTSEVLRRCWAALFPRANFLDVLEGNPDLYGPFWITTSVVLILFLASTIAQYFTRAKDAPYYYDFGLLSGAAGLMYGYTAVVPVALWGVLKWYGSESANLLECLALYGYANLIWVPVAIASVSPISILNWVFVAVGLGVSGLFLFRNLYPVVNATDAKTAKVLLILIVVLQAGLALAIKILFFAHGSPVAAKKPEGDAPKKGDMMFF